MKKEEGTFVYMFVQEASVLVSYLSTVISNNPAALFVCSLMFLYAEGWLCLKSNNALDENFAAALSTQCCSVCITCNTLSGEFLIHGIKLFVFLLVAC